MSSASRQQEDHWHKVSPKTDLPEPKLVHIDGRQAVERQASAGPSSSNRQKDYRYELHKELTTNKASGDRHGLRDRSRSRPPRANELGTLVNTISMGRLLKRNEMPSVSASSYKPSSTVWALPIFKTETLISAISEGHECSLRSVTTSVIKPTATVVIALPTELPSNACAGSTGYQHGDFNIWPLAWSRNLE